MELSPHQSNPYIQVKQKNGKASGKEMLLFDSGMSGFYDLSVSAYEQFKKIDLFQNINEAAGSYTIGLHGLAETQYHYKVFLPELSINDHVFTGLIVKTTYDETSRIGSDIFKYGDVTLDYKHKKFYFEPYSVEPTLVKDTYWPVEPTFNGDKLVIGLIWDKALMDRIKIGDEIISIGSITYSSMSMCEIMVSERDIAEDKALLVLKDLDTGEIKEIEITKGRM